MRGPGSIPGQGVFLFLWPNWRNGSAPAYGAGGCGFDPHVGLGLVIVAQSADRPLHTRKAQGSIPCENCLSFIRYGVVGNMSGSHPVASGSIPGIGLLLFHQPR